MYPTLNCSRTEALYVNIINTGITEVGPISNYIISAMLRCFYRYATGIKLKLHAILMQVTATSSICTKISQKKGWENMCFDCRVALQLPRKYSSPAATGWFDSRTSQIGHSVVSGSPPLPRFFGFVMPRR